jgi:hypothetical protein
MSARAEGSPQGRSRAIRQEADKRVPALCTDRRGRAMSARAEGSPQGRSRAIRQEAAGTSFVLRHVLSEAGR